MNNNVLISVIIPVYNAEKYLRECLDSVINQTLKDIEIICINDGSTDNSINILNEYKEKDNRIKVISQENLGPGLSRNNGIKNSNGEFICFMDSDDFYPNNNTLELLYTSAKKNNVNICGGTLNRFDNNIIIPKEYLFNDYGLINYKDYQYDYGYTRFIYNRKFLIDNNIYFPNYLRQQDPVFFVNAMIASKTFYVLNMPTYVYRVSHNKKPIEWTIKKAEDVAKSFKDLLILSSKNNLNKLHNTIIKRICSDWDINIFKILENENEPNKCLIDMINSINYDIVYNNNPNFSLPPFYKKLKSSLKFSIIISVYNMDKWLSECLDSVINQTLKDIEIICVDDGSTDNSLNILNDYAKKDNRIKVITQQNMGLSASRNKALSISSGKYCSFVDADDYLDENALLKLFEYAEKNNLDMLSFSGYNFDENNEKINNPYWNFNYLPKDWNKTVFTYKDCLSFMISMAVSSCLTIYKKEYISNNNLTFPEGVVYEDNLFWLKAFTKNARFGILKEKFYYRRLHNSSITHNWKKNFNDYIKICGMVLDYLKSIKINTNVYKCYRKAYINSMKKKFIKLTIHEKNLIRKSINDFIRKYR